MLVKFINVGRNKENWTAELKTTSQIVNEAKKALLSNDIFIKMNTDRTGTILVGINREVGSFEILD